MEHLPGLITPLAPLVRNNQSVCTMTMQYASLYRVQIRSIVCRGSYLFPVWPHHFPTKVRTRQTKPCLLGLPTEELDGGKAWEQGYLSFTHIFLLCKSNETFVFSTSMPSIQILLIYTKVPRSTKKLVAGVRERYERVRSTGSHTSVQILYSNQKCYLHTTVNQL